MKSRKNMSIATALVRQGVVPKRLLSPALALLLATSVLPAHGAYTTVDYTGMVSRIYSPGTGSEADIVLGTPVSFSFTFDPSKFVTFGTFDLPNGATGAPMVVHPAGVSLYDDPGASYTITIASHTWTLADEDDGGYVTPTGIGPNPFVTFDGSPSQLIGFSGDAVNAEGLEFSSNPADFFLQYNRYPIYGGSTGDGVEFAVSTSLDPTILALRAAALAAGQVPEPSTWALLLSGAVGLWMLSRRRGAPAGGMARPA